MPCGCCRGPRPRRRRGARIRPWVHVPAGLSGRRAGAPRFEKKPARPMCQLAAHDRRFVSFGSLVPPRSRRLDGEGILLSPSGSGAAGTAEYETSTPRGAGLATQRPGRPTDTRRAGRVGERVTQQGDGRTWPLAADRRRPAAPAVGNFRRRDAAPPVPFVTCIPRRSRTDMDDSPIGVCPSKPDGHPRQAIARLSTPSGVTGQLRDAARRAATPRSLRTTQWNDAVPHPGRPHRPLLGSDVAVRRFCRTPGPRERPRSTLCVRRAWPRGSPRSAALRGGGPRCGGAARRCRRSPRPARRCR